MRTRISLILAILCLLPVCANATTYGEVHWTEGHHEIYAEDSYGEIWMYNDCTLDILGGDISRLAAYDTTVTNWYDGTMVALWAKENSIVNIYGGRLVYYDGRRGDIWADGQSVINLYAYDITHTTTGDHYGFGRLTGKYYLNDSPFGFDLYSSETYSHINIVPEPATFILLALGGMFLRKK